MNEQKSLEIVIDSIDEGVVRDIENSLAAVQPVRSRKARIVDPVTVLGIAAGAIKLVNELIALKKALESRGDATKVTIRNLEGETVVLSGADMESLSKLTQ